jgi:hypothetical protein
MFRGTAVVSVVLALAVSAAPAASSGTPAERSDGIDYVAIGDSYSAGPMIPSPRYDPSTCLRSTDNYPAYLAGYLDVATYRDVTCSAAKVRDLFHAESTRISGTSSQPQLGALSADTDVVTFGIGANEFGIFGTLFSYCIALAPSAPGAHPCRSYFTDAHGNDTLMRDAKMVRRHVDRGLLGVERHAPNARVFVVGYPQVIPAHGTCAAVPLAAGDYAWTRAVLERVNLSMRQAAQDRHATYVDLSRSSAGHDACAGSAAWVNGNDVDMLRAANFHPFQVGEHAAGREIYRVVTGHAAPKDGSANAAPPPGSVVLNGS